MISRQLVTHFLSRSFFSASPEFVCQNCQKCQTTRGAKKSVKSVNFCSLWGGCSSSMSCVGYRQPGICLSKLSKVSSDPGGEKERQKRQFCSLQFHVLCRLQAARNLSVKTVKSVKRPGGRKRASKALLLSLGRVFQFHVLCRPQAARNLRQNCQKCQTTWERKRASEASILLSLGRVFQFHVLCRLQASFRDMGQNSTFRRPVDSAMCGPELKQSLVLKNACKEPPNGFKGAPSQQLRRPATRKPALAGF